MNVKIHTKNSSYALQTEGRTSVLLDALAQGIDLPYACATGTCGSCKATLISGQVDDNWPDALGKDKLKVNSGELLLCQCSARNDCEIQITDFVYRTDPGTFNPKHYSGVITQWRLLTRDVALWEVELAECCEFNAGQFALVSLPGVDGYRAYSMVDFERSATRLTFLTKRKPEGRLTEVLFSETPIGKAVQVVAPLGRAVFSPGLKRNLLCIAGGSGIAGIMSILSRATQEGYFTQFKGYIFFGVRTMQDAFFLEELSAFERASGGNLKIVVGLSEGAATEDDRARYPALSFDMGLIHEIASRHMEGTHKNLQAYLAGPAPSVDAAIRHLVITAKLDPKFIAYDKFS